MIETKIEYTVDLNFHHTWVFAIVEVSCNDRTTTNCVTIGRQARESDDKQGAVGPDDN